MSSEFEDIVNGFQVVDPLSIAGIVDGMRNLAEASLYLHDYISDFFVSMTEASETLEDEDDGENEIILEDIPAFSHKATVYLTMLFDSAKTFCEVVTSESGGADDNID